MSSPNSYRFDENFIQDALKTHNPDGPIFVILFFRYRDMAKYPEDASPEFQNLPACTGQEAMIQRYIPAVEKAQAANGFEQQVIHGGPVIGTLHSKAGEQWDDVWLVKMSRFQNWANMIMSNDYKNHTWPHCAAACEDLTALLVGAHPLP